MGNNLGGVNIRSHVHFPLSEQLGSNASIFTTARSFSSDMQKVTVKYMVDGSTCELYLNSFPSHNQLTFGIQDDMFSGGDFAFAVHKADRDLLKLSIQGLDDRVKVAKATKTKDPSGGSITKTNVFFYGKGSKGGLVVLQQKIKNGDVNPYKVIVAHYYAVSSGNIFIENEVDIGLSMALNIQRSMNEYDVVVEGPDQHPSSALFYMFKQVSDTGIWKPMVCPHCAYQRQMINSAKIGQSESEDDCEGLQLRGPKQNATSVLANCGEVRGNNNGNLYVDNLIYKGKSLKCLIKEAGPSPAAGEGWRENVRGMGRRERGEKSWRKMKEKVMIDRM